MPQGSNAAGKPVEAVGLRPVAPDETANLPAEQGGEADQKQDAREFAGCDGPNQQSDHRQRDHRQQRHRGRIDARAQAADPAAGGECCRRPR